MSHKIRLGPIAVFLAVIAAVLASLAILTVSTSRADAVLAARFANVTKIKYELEADGSRFLQAADAYYQGAGPLPEGAWETESGLGYYKEKEGYTLDVEVQPDGGAITVTEWKITKIWEGEDPFEDLWLG